MACLSAGFNDELVVTKKVGEIVFFNVVFIAGYASRPRAPVLSPSPQYCVSVARNRFPVYYKQRQRHEPLALLGRSPSRFRLYDFAPGFPSSIGGVSLILMSSSIIAWGMFISCGMPFSL